jgi:soluble lytic murein transglycosylase-like protein
MDIRMDLAAVTRRIAEIAGENAAPPQSAPGGSFASLVSAAMNQDSAPAPAARFEGLIGDSAASNGVDPALIKAIIANESSFDPSATSPTGAQGLMQLEPGTAAGLGVTDPYDPAQNIAGGTRYFKGLLERYNGDVRLALAAYNAGPSAVEKYAGVPPYVETQRYVEAVLGSYAKYKAQ